MQDFRNLKVWQKSHALTLRTCEFSAQLRHAGTFFIREQLVRAAVSVSANIAEGCGRAGDRDFRRFIRIALGSASELEYHLLLARDPGILPDASYEPLAGQVAEVKRMLSGLAARLSSS